MNKTDLAKKIAEENSLSQKQASAVLDCVLSTVMDTVAAGDKVSIPGFGTFEARQRAARTGHNPRSGEEVEIPAATIPAFKPGKTFKDKVNG